MIGGIVVVVVVAAVVVVERRDPFGALVVGATVSPAASDVGACVPELVGT